MCQPLQVFVYDAREDLVENICKLHHLQVKELQHENELLADCVYDKLVLRAENFLKVELLPLVLTDSHDDRLSVHALKD